MKIQRLILSGALLAGFALSSGMVVAQTTVYFDLKKTTQPCNTATEISTKSGTSEFDLPDAVAYPNPFSENVTVRANSGMDRISIHDISGKLLTYTEADGASQITLPGSALPNGIYFFIIAFENGAKITRKLCKTY